MPDASAKTDGLDGTKECLKNPDARSGRGPDRSIGITVVCENQKQPRKGCFCFEGIEHLPKTDNAL